MSKTMVFWLLTEICFANFLSAGNLLFPSLFLKSEALTNRAKRDSLFSSMFFAKQKSSAGMIK